MPVGNCVQFMLHDETVFAIMLFEALFLQTSDRN
eukprot:CAMPEP_0202719094 /NCGR_PEP_ID=MMETSP1385-20130828/127983_1 /ASSEMBLY_ACC=CAM_ASM_000861 /TAXON_ID=933848 /ORGANISM="Elphidium margaritaceum" /LENGTH=33 /DNA_ID= /DNA_START= /DNA_END= /DNA_ORIENTATION=